MEKGLKAKWKFEMGAEILLRRVWAASGWETKVVKRDVRGPIKFWRNVMGCALYPLPHRGAEGWLPSLARVWELVSRPSVSSFLDRLLSMWHKICGGFLLLHILKVRNLKSHPYSNAECWVLSAEFKTVNKKEQTPKFPHISSRKRQYEPLKLWLTTFEGKKNNSLSFRKTQNKVPDLYLLIRQSQG